MKDPIQRCFQVGTIQQMTYPPVNYPILDFVKTVYCGEYFSALEIAHIEDQEIKDKVRDMLAQGYTKVCYGAQLHLLGPKLNPNDLDEEGRRKMEAVLVDPVDEAQYVGVKGIAFLAGKWESGTKDQAYTQLLKAIRAVCGYAASKGIMVELEVFDFDMGKAALIGPAPYVARFAADMCTIHNNLGLLVDLSYFPTTCEASRLVIQTLRPYITHLHIGNAVVKEGFEAYGDRYPRFRLPDSADDTEQPVNFLAVLKEEGFSNKDNPYVLSLEVKPWANKDGGIILTNIKRVTNRAWALVEDQSAFVRSLRQERAG